jgi:hypothetical protein
MTLEEQQRVFSAGPVSAAEGFRIAETCAINAVGELRNFHNHYLSENETIRQEGFAPYSAPDEISAHDRSLSNLTYFYLRIFSSRGLVTLGPK